MKEKKSYLLIAGSRHYTDKATFDRVLAEYLNGSEGKTVIVTGGAKGADALAKEYAIEHAMGIEEFLPDWERYGRAAGPKRNDHMTNYIATNHGRALYFWNMESKGTKQCIKSAKKLGIPVTIYNTGEGRFEDA